MGKAFREGRGFTQAKPASDMILNMLVDAVVRVVLEEVCRPQKSCHGTGWVAGEWNIVFYAGNVRISGRYSEWVQESLSVTVAMFYRVGLAK